MIRKQITHKDFIEIGKSNEYFLWHFLQKNQVSNSLSLYSIFDKKPQSQNPLEILLDGMNVSYYESYTQDSIDFLLGSGINGVFWAAPPPNVNPSPEYLFKPFVALFKGYSFKGSTFQACYCVEGIIDVIGKENPEILSGLS